MFDKFGEFNSADEINRAAAAQLKEGDTDAILTLAAENGIDKEDAEDYAEGYIDTLATVRTAAIGKLKVETADLKLNGILIDWKDVIVEECLNSEEMCEAVRRKGKCLRDCMAQLIRHAFENKVQISDKIVDVTKVTVNGRTEAMRKPLYLGAPNRSEAKRIIRAYYLGK